MTRVRELVFAAAFVMMRLCNALSPEKIYDGGYGNCEHSDIELRIGNGGAGQSGLIKALADQFIQDRVADGRKPFKVAWYESDTTYSIRYLKSGAIDVGITYSLSAEQIALDEGIIKTPIYYAFRDHFLLVGPPSNPANLSKSTSVAKMFTKLYEAGEGPKTVPPVRFLTRYDKSATNIKESTLWISNGEVPWATPYSTWYHQYIAFPLEALTAAIVLNEYTITDRGTLLSLDANLRNKTTVYKAGSDDENDPLLNPAHLLIGTKSQNIGMAQAFAEWLVGDKGQRVIINFKKNGEQLYSPAPTSNVTACDCRTAPFHFEIWSKMTVGIKQVP